MSRRARISDSEVDVSFPFPIKKLGGCTRTFKLSSKPPPPLLRRPALSLYQECVASTCYAKASRAISAALCSFKLLLRVERTFVPRREPREAEPSAGRARAPARKRVFL